MMFSTSGDFRIRFANSDLWCEACSGLLGDFLGPVRGLAS